MPAWKEMTMVSTPSPLHDTDAGAPTASTAPPRNSQQATGPDPLIQLEQAARQVAESASTYAHATLDAFRLGVRNFFARLVLMTLLAIAGLVTIIVGVVLLLNGLAHALAAGFGGPLWVGYIVMGLFAAAAPIAIWQVRTVIARKRSFRETQAKYEARDANRAA